MQRYIEQLIEDIEEAKNRPRPPKMLLPPELEFVRGAEEYLHGEQYEMGKLFGLEIKQFPPEDKLSEEEIQALTDKITELWQVFNFIPVFPEGLPVKYKYKLLVDYLEYKTTYISEGNNHFEFCTYDPESCPFPEEFCTCKDFEFDDEDLEMPPSDDFDEDALPF